MTASSARYIVDDTGARVGVVLEVAEYRRLLEAADELAALQAYDQATASGDEAIPFEQAVLEIEQQR